MVYTDEMMLDDFLSPKETIKTSDLVGKEAVVKAVTFRPKKDDKHPDCYMVEFEVGGKRLLSFVSAMHPYRVFSKFGESLIECVVTFRLNTTADGHKYLKMTLVKGNGNDFKA